MAETPKPPPVTEKELQQLPRWAIVAFATRCARRVEPLLAQVWSKAPYEHIQAISRSITIAESSARTGRGEDSTIFSAAAYANASANDDAADTNADDLIAAFAVTNAAGEAAKAAYFASNIFANSTASNANSDVVAAAYLAAVNAVNAINAHDANGGGDAANVAARSDYDLLLTRASRARWTNDTPVDVSTLGPLWPNGDPFARTAAEKAYSVAEILQRLSQELGESEVQRYFEGQTKLSLDGVHLYITVPSSFLAQFLERQFGESIRRAAGGLPSLTLQFLVDPSAFGDNTPSPIDCYFDLSEFSAEDIAAILGGLSAYYNKLTGDELIIDDCGVADVSEVLEPAGGGA